MTTGGKNQSCAVAISWKKRRTNRIKVSNLLEGNNCHEKYTNGVPLSLNMALYNSKTLQRFNTVYNLQIDIFFFSILQTETDFLLIEMTKSSAGNISAISSFKSTTLTC